MSFPVKHKFWEKADLDLILESAQALKAYAKESPNLVFVMAHPGCHNGKRDWKREVKPLLQSVELPDNVWVVDLADVQD